jgi:hypothetical protein
MVSDEERKVIDAEANKFKDKIPPEIEFAVFGMAHVIGPVCGLIDKARQVDPKMGRELARMIMCIIDLFACSNLDDGITLLKETEEFIQKTDKHVMEQLRKQYGVDK